MNASLYLIGYPGAGKTTALERAVTGIAAAPLEALEAPLPHRTAPAAHSDSRIILLGRDRPVFGGTDSYALNVNPKAIAWMRSLADTPGPTLVCGEGDRLANRAFLSACPNLVVVYLDVPPQVAVRRAWERADANGFRRQGAAWTKGRRTKVDRLADWASDLPGSIYAYRRISGGTIDENAAALAAILRSLLEHLADV